MFNKILIANRGEIACRVISSCKKLGVKTVAVYSDADRNAKHVQVADEAIHIGAAAVSESYLQADRIIAAALSTGAQAIHPGYGFLSENPGFVRAVEAAGLFFIGPSASAIEAMGLKDAAKVLMDGVGVPVVPGYNGESQDSNVLQKEAEKIGFPVLIKARAGGGGKGMRLVESASDFKDMLEAAQREGQASFGDPVCLIEKYINQPRHIEVQIFADNHGNVVHLFERDCSLQRRHQKVIEEAPAPGMPEEVRAAMGQAAVDAAKSINYSGAGTVEFIVDSSSGLTQNGFWFMEMNTRLQVEHPVSEAITGLDFVELQLRVAANERLPFTQSDLAIDGWAFEARVYAEDVAKGFLPAVGIIDYLSFPEGSEFEAGAYRVDSGIRQGDEISPYYDPMIAKIVVHGPTRAVALNMLTLALSQTHVGGSVTNRDFLSALSTHKGFVDGAVDTNLISQHLISLTKQDKPSDVLMAASAVWCLGLLPANSKQLDLWDELIGWRHWSVCTQNASFVINDETIEKKVSIFSANHFRVDDENNSVELHIEHVDKSSYKVCSGGACQTLVLAENDLALSVFDLGITVEVKRVDPLVVESNAEESSDNLLAPIPGSITVVNVQKGQSVKAGEKLILLEAMKMEHALLAPRDGVVADVFYNTGDQVGDGELLLSLESSS
ncbi:UNVERIFIED_CONTAM: hypothetical protein GTU68_048398 [Idotea baltica]|nr:hypothetical protein [Idotea baltica]